MHTPYELPTLRSRLAALRASAWPIAQTAFAAALAWLIATELLHHQAPFFAPVSACIAVGITIGRRGRRALELSAGVAVGILVGDALLLAIGTGALQLGAVIALAMGVAVLLGGGQHLLVTQAAISAALVATLQPPQDGITFDRFVDALVGGGLGLAVSLLLPVAPLGRAKAAAAPVFAELAGTLRDVAGALRDRDAEAAEDALLRARAIDAPMRGARDAMADAAELARYAPGRRAERTEVDRWSAALQQVDLAVRNTRVLARGAIRAIALDENVPPGTARALEELAQAVDALAASLTGGAGRDDAVEHARQAAATATDVLEQTGNLSVSVIVGQVRSTAVDLLRGLGMGRDTATQTVRGASQE